MKINYLVLAMVSFAMLPYLTGCIADEPLNKECDILSAYVHVQDPDAFFFNASDSVVRLTSTENEVIFKMQPNINLVEQLHTLAPVFDITQGATILPPSGQPQDFTQGPILYTVTSEDGQWSRQYKVSVKVDHEVRKFDFENPYLVPRSKTFFYDWVEFDANGDSLKIWASGNPGYSLTNGTSPASDFPTFSSDDGFEGKCARLVTRSTGILGAMFDMPIAAGNLFIGRFDLTNALMNALTSTLFGRPVGYKPIRLEGYYKYQPGPLENKIDKPDSPMLPADVADEGSIYSVFFANRDDDGNEVFLDGTNVMTSERIVALAVADVQTADQWTKFSVDFDYRADVDPDVLKNRGYSLAVVFSSSTNGDYFVGSVGSELWVDNVRIVTEDDEE